MRRQFFGVLAVATASLLVLTACSGSSSGSETATDGFPAPQVGVILPDSASSPRWEAEDRPYLKAAFDAAGIQSDIQNAGNDVATFQTIADNMISEKVKVILIVSLNANSGKAVITKANKFGIPVIDYDRLTLGGGAQYYVSYDKRGGRHRDRRGPDQMHAGRRSQQWPGGRARRLAGRQQRHPVPPGLQRRADPGRLHDRRPPGSARLGPEQGRRAVRHHGQPAQGPLLRRRRGQRQPGWRRRRPAEERRPGTPRSRSPARTPASPACSGCCSAPSA